MITGFSSAALMQLEGAMRMAGGGGSGGGVIVIDLERLTEQVEELTRIAGSISRATENPTWAAGDELCRRAALALEHGWLDEAVRDARASIEAYPYRAAPYLLHALAELAAGETVEAYESLRAAIKYGSAAEPSHAATAGILAASISSAASADGAALDDLRAAARSTGWRCPEVVQALHQFEPVDPLNAAKLVLDDPEPWLGSDRRRLSLGSLSANVSVAFEALLSAASQLASDSASCYRVAAGTGSLGGEDRPNLRDYDNATKFRLVESLVQSLADQADALAIPERIVAGHSLLTALVVLPAYEDASRDLEFPRLFEVAPVRRPKWWASRIDPVVMDAFVENRRKERNRAFAERRMAVATRDGAIDNFNNKEPGIYERAEAGLLTLEVIQRDLDSILSRTVEKPKSRFWGYSEPSSYHAAVRTYDESLRRQDRARRASQLPNPPGLQEIDRAIAQWVQVTKPSGESVIRPFGGVFVPVISATAHH